MSHSVRDRETPLELTFSQLLFGAIALMSFVLFYILDFTLIPSFGIDLRCCTHVGQFAVDHRLYVGTCNKTGLLVYSQIIFATLVGFWVYGCWPNGIACFGMSVIVTCGALSATSRIVPTSQRAWRQITHRQIDIAPTGHLGFSQKPALGHRQSMWPIYPCSPRAEWGEAISWACQNTNGNRVHNAFPLLPLIKLG